MDPKPYVLLPAAAGTKDAKPISLDLTEVPGYDAAETQTLKHIEGVLTWETDI